MRLLAMACVVVLLMAGCSEPADVPDEEGAPAPVQLSPKQFDVLPVQEMWVPVSDGKRLHHAVYRPDTEEPVPVFINFSPYWGDTAEARGDAFSQYMIDEYVPRGYAVVLSAIRGTGHSEGCFQIGGDRELRDVHEAVDLFAKQPWSNGHIAAGGKSYDSTSQNGMIAKFPHPALKGIFHVSGITDMYRYNHVHGVPYATGPAFNTYYYLQGTDEYGVSLVGAGSHEDEDAESLARLLDDVACTELPAIQAHGVGSGVTGMKTDYWIERDWIRFVGDTTWNGSIFFVHGLQDWNVKPDHVLPWIEELPPQVRVKGWLHQDTYPGSGGHVYPMRTDWNLTMLRWLDSELKGIDSGLWQEPSWQIQSTDGTWYHEPKWPLVLFEELTIPTDVPVPVDALAYAAQPMRISGSIRLDVEVWGPHPDPVVTATVYDVAPDGGRTWVGEAVGRVLYRNGLEAPSAYTGQAEMSLWTYPLDHVLPQGHHLRAEYQTGSRNALVLPWQTQGVDVFQTGFGVPLTHAQPMEEQPKPMRCFAC